MIQAAKPDPASKIRIHQPATSYEHVKVLVHGLTGVGKTVLAGTAPEPLFLDCEKGMTSIQHQVATWPIESWADAVEAIKFIRAYPQSYQTIVVDPLTELLDLAMRNVVRGYDQVKREYGDQPTLADWGKGLNDFTRLVKALRDLPIRVICTAASLQPAYQGQRMQPDFQGKHTVETVCRYMDVIGYMYIRPGKEGGEDERPSRAITFDSVRAETKDRTGLLPPTVADPTWAKIAAHWQPKENKGATK